MDDVIVDIVMQMKPPLEVGYTQHSIMRWRIEKALDMAREETIRNFANAIGNIKRKDW